MEVWLWIVLGLTGAVVGSFLNVVIYRLPQRLSLVYPPSHCMSCGKQLTPLDLIPVLGYFLLRGRCRWCGHRFSIRYALVEAATALLAVGAVYYHGPTLYAGGIFVACCALLVAFFVDLDHMIIPDQVPLLLVGMGLLFNLYRPLAWGADWAIPFTEKVGGQTYVAYLPIALVGMLVGAGVFLIIGWVFEQALGRPALGFGDVKLAGGVGAVLGPGYQFLVFFLIAVIVGAIISVLLLALGRKRQKHYLPFGPMLALSAIGMLLWPEVLTPWVLGFYGG